MEKWTGKLAVVTGASSGIGAAIVRDLSKAGINVAALARRADRLDELKDELKEFPGKVYAMMCDVSDKAAVERIFKQIDEKYGAISIMINNAGTMRAVEILDDDDETFEEIEEVVQTNLMGLINCSRKAYQSMKKADDYGIIIQISSIVGHSIPFIPIINFNVYPGSKHAVRASTEVMRQELIKKKNTKIRVAEISPGAVMTEIGQAAISKGPTPKVDIKSIKSDYAALNDFDVSQTVMFLLSTPYNVNVTEIIIKPVGEKF